MKFTKSFLFLSLLVFFSYINSMEIIPQPMRNCWELSQELYDNIATFDIIQLKNIVEAGASVDYPKAGKKPILFFTLHDYQKTKFLLDNGANLNQIYKGKTPLRAAMQPKKCDLALIKLFLMHVPQDKCLATLVRKNSPRLANLFIEQANLDEQERLYCIYESLSMRQMRIAHIFMKQHPHYKIAFDFRLACESSKLDPNQKRQVLTITETLCNLSDADFGELKKNFGSGTK